MLIDIKSVRLQLDRKQHFRLRGAFDTRLSCANGVAWITIEGGAGDVILAPGDAFVVPQDATVLVGPIHGSVTLDVRSTPQVMRRELHSPFPVSGMLRAILGYARQGVHG